MARPVEFDRKKVLTNAMNQFWLEGYEASSIEKLLSCTGINRGSLYNSFGDKEEFFKLCTSHYFQTIIQPLLEPLNDMALNDWDAIVAFFDGVVSTSNGSGCLLVNALCGSEKHNTRLMLNVDASLGVIRTALLFRLKCCKKKSQIKVSYNLAADVLMDLMYGLRVQSRAGATARGLRRVVTCSLEGI